MTAHAMPPTPSHTVSKRHIRLDAPDGFMLEGTLFEGAGTGPLVLISSATAVPRGLYAGFASAAGAGSAGAPVFSVPVVFAPPAAASSSVARR